VTVDNGEAGRLLRAYHDRGEGAARARLVELHMPLVEKLARRLKRGSDDVDDLVQVGSIGLIKAIDGFRPDRGQDFGAYAVPTITGEIKRHLRDTGSSVRVPRRLQEVSAQARTAQLELGARLGRAPTTAELSRELDIDEAEVARALDSERARVAMALPDEGEATEAEEEDFESKLDLSEDRLLLADGLRALSDDERQIVYMRFIRGVSRSETARELGISQRQLTRQQGKALAKLKRELEGDGHPDKRPVVAPVQRLSGRSKAPTIPSMATTAVSEVERYLSLPYHIVLLREETGDEKGRWKASVEELPGCEASGASSEEAARAIYGAMEKWIGEALEKGAAVPEPRSQSNSSGRLLLRMPQTLHAELARHADREEVSLNGYITGLLASAVGWQQDEGASTKGGTAGDGPAARSRFVSVAILVNIVVLAIAAVAAVILLVLAWQQGW